MKQKEYYEILKEQLERQVTEEGDSIEKVAQICAASVMKKRLIHVFGCGHSQMFAMENVDKIAKTPTTFNDRPRNPQVIDTITIVD